MFNLGWTEILVIAVIAIIIVGPRDLPGMLRSAGQLLGRVRRMASDFQKTFNDAIKDAERQAGVDEIRKEVESVKKLNPVNDLKKSLSVDNLINSDNNKASQEQTLNTIEQPANNIESSEAPTDQITNTNQINENNVSSDTDSTTKLDSRSKQSSTEPESLELKSIEKTPENSQNNTENTEGDATTLFGEKSAA